MAGKKKWTEGTIRKRLDERSYDVETEKGTLRRNRIHIRRMPINENNHTRSAPQMPLNTSDTNRRMVLVNRTDGETVNRRTLPTRESRGTKPAWMKGYVSK